MHGDQEIATYCEVANNSAAWNTSWREYAAILRHAAKLDGIATRRILAGESLPLEFQAALDSAYLQAFALSRAKGAADAAWLDSVSRPFSRSAYGLPGDFAAVTQKIARSKNRLSSFS